MASRGIDIPPVKPGDAVTESMLNQIVRGANRGRITTGSGGVSAKQIGSSMMLQGDFKAPDEKTRLLLVSGSADNSGLPGGMYQATILVSPFWFEVAAASVDVTAQANGFPSCYFFNLPENGLTTHSMVADKIVMARFAGFTDDGVAVYCASFGDNGGYFDVIVKANGVDGSGFPKYDLYAPWDTGYTIKLNLAGALIPKCSRARLNATIDPIAPADGSEAEAKYDTAGAIQLWNLPETFCNF